MFNVGSMISHTCHMIRDAQYAYLVVGPMTTTDCLMMHRGQSLVVGDCAFPKNMGDDDPLTVLVLRVYPFRSMLCCWMPSKGRDPRVVAR